jgi:hypothetical protein
MADTNWLLEALKVGGGAAIGWGSRVFQDRDKKAKMRKRLYRELLLNYMKLQFFLEYVDSFVQDDLPPQQLKLALVPLERDYYEHARKDMDVYTELKEGASFNHLYESVVALNQLHADVAPLDEDFLIMQAQEFAEHIESLFKDGSLDLGLAKKAMHANHYPILREKSGGAPSALERLKALVARRNTLLPQSSSE